MLSVPYHVTPVRRRAARSPPPRARRSRNVAPTPWSRTATSPASIWETCLPSVDARVPHAPIPHSGRPPATSAAVPGAVGRLPGSGLAQRHLDRVARAEAALSRRAFEKAMKYLPPRLATVVTKEIAVHRDLTFGRLLVPVSVSFFGISIPVLTGGGRPVCRGRAAQRLTSSGRPVPLRVRRSLLTPDVARWAGCGALWR